VPNERGKEEEGKRDVRSFIEGESEKEKICATLGGSITSASHKWGSWGASVQVGKNGPASKGEENSFAPNERRAVGRNSRFSKRESSTTYLKKGCQRDDGGYFEGGLLRENKKKSSSRAGRFQGQGTVKRKAQHQEISERNLILARECKPRGRQTFRGTDQALLLR